MEMRYDARQPLNKARRAKTDLLPRAVFCVRAFSLSDSLSLSRVVPLSVIEILSGANIWLPSFSIHDLRCNIEKFTGTSCILLFLGIRIYGPFAFIPRLERCVCSRKNETWGFIIYYFFFLLLFVDDWG